VSPSGLLTALNLLPGPSSPPPPLTAARSPLDLRPFPAFFLPPPILKRYSAFPPSFLSKNLLTSPCVRKISPPPPKQNTSCSPLSNTATFRQVNTRFHAHPIFDGTENKQWPLFSRFIAFSPLQKTTSVIFLRPLCFSNDPPNDVLFFPQKISHTVRFSFPPSDYKLPPLLPLCQWEPTSEQPPLLHR